MPEPRVAAKERCVLGESPLWSPADQMLYWVDVRNPMIHALDPATGERRRWRVQTEIGSIGLAAGGRLVAGTRMGFAYVGLEDGAFEEICDPEGDGRLNRVRLNDGKVDRRGRFWCGGMEDPGMGEVASLYRLDAGGAARRMAGPVRIANALCWSPDDRTMYFSDSPTGVVWAYEFDAAAGEIANRRVFVEIAGGDGLPDGATTDAAGFVWIALMRGGAVRRYDPDGRLEREIAFPASLTTCPAFGGPGLSTLYVTTASTRFEAADFEREPDAGSLFAVETDATGVPEPVFGGDPSA